MIRVAHIITSLTTGGAETMLGKLLLAMDRGRFASEVICLTQNGPIGTQLEEAGFPVHVLGMRRHWPWPSNRRSLMRRFADFKPDLIQGWMYHGNLAALVLKRPANTLWNIRATVSPGLTGERLTTRWVIQAGARRSGLVRNILYNSRRSRTAHEAIGYEGSRARVIPNGFVVDRFRPDPRARAELRKEWNISDETMIFGIVGRFHPVKDHPNFLRAARKVLDIHPTARFIMVGTRRDADSTELSTLVRSLGLQDAVSMLGERRDVHRITAAFDVAVLSSRSEAFPNVLGEAMACGVPCVATDVGDSGWLIGDTGVIVPPRDSDALAQGMIRLLNAGTAARSEMGMRARKRIEENFSMDAVAQSYENLYAEVVDRNRLEGPN